MSHNPITHVNTKEVIVFDEITTSSTSDHVDVDMKRFGTVLIQVQIGLSGKITIEGKLEAADNWVDVNGVINDNVITRINTYPMMRAKAANINGPCTVIFRFDRGR